MFHAFHTQEQWLGSRRSEPEACKVMLDVIGEVKKYEAALEEAAGTRPELCKLEDEMGLILCPKHGPTGLALVCSHIHSAVITVSPVTEFEVWEYYIVEDIRMPNWLCAQCLEALRSRGLPDTGFSPESEEDDAMLQRVFKQVEGVESVVCGSCLMECIAMSRDGTHGE
jgi:hypothetical protein